MKRLSRSEFQATFTQEMRAVTTGSDPPFDFWPYFEEIPDADFCGFDCSEGQVDNAWQTSCGRFIHVLVKSKTANVFMAVLLDTASAEVYGHHLLNLNDEYGLST